MRIIRTLITIVAIASLAGALTACQDEGPMERAGKAVDDAASDVVDAADDANDKVKDAME
jgi:Ni/Co efflux regulator RcnB